MSGSNGKRINSTASTRRYSSYPAEEKQEAKVTYLTEFELNNQPNMIRNGGSSELHNGSNNNLVKHSDMSIVEQSIGNIHHSSSSSTTTSTTATLNNSSISSRHHMRSEDELSAVSTSKSIFPFFFYQNKLRFKVIKLKRFKKIA